jgi:hypothetical protein
LGIWVDDIIGFTKTKADQDWILEKLNERYEVRDAGPLKFLLGIQFDVKEDSVSLSQRGYIRSKAEEFGVQDCRPTWTPTVVGQVEEISTVSITDQPKIREITGSVMHAMVNTRPDICHGVNLVSRVLEQATPANFESAKRILKYLNTTQDLSLNYKRQGNIALEMYVDSNDGSSKRYEQPTWGYIIKVAGAAVAWKSRKMGCANLSSAE